MVSQSSLLVARDPGHVLLRLRVLRQPVNHRARTKAIVGGMLIEYKGGNGRRIRHMVAYLFVVVKQTAMTRILGLGTVVVVLLPISAGEDAMDAAHSGLRLRLGPELTASVARQVRRYKDVDVAGGRLPGVSRQVLIHSPPTPFSRTPQHRQPRPILTVSSGTNATWLFLTPSAVVRRALLLFLPTLPGGRILLTPRPRWIDTLPYGRHVVSSRHLIEQSFKRTVSLERWKRWTRSCSMLAGPPFGSHVFARASSGRG